MGVINNNTSYTNKDFQSIYSELLDIIPNLTNRWNPSSEADPGMVLVKLMAVLGDKLNYNIDKQVLECFPGSVTQRKNARQMFNLIGYEMSWYKAATVTVGFKLKEPLVNSEEDGFNSVTIPRFTKITDANTSVSFYTLSEVKLYGDDTETIKYVSAMQGNLNEYSVNNSVEVKLSNLDEDYKLYLTDINVADNGIFVKDAGASVYDWQQVANVNAQPLGTKCYEFGIADDESQCYLKFPSDVNNQCKSDSLEISYITCDGYNGNIVSNVLSNFGSSVLDSEDVAVEDKIAIIQPEATVNGADPETIEEAYKNSRKVIGTFNTLVTKQDFQNFIKLLIDSNNLPMVSNVVVADRTNDPNKVVQVKSIENFKTYDRIVNNNITAYDLVTYMLRYQPIDFSESTEVCDTNYNLSFVPVSDETTKLIIENEMDEVKAINIDINLADNGETCLYKGKYALTAELITTEKLTADEAEELEKNVKKQLEKEYHAFNMEFGEEISYSDLIDTITSIDSRIKAVSLRGIDYNINKVVMGTDGDQALTESDYIDIVAKSIAKGNVQAYKFKDNFKVDFGQKGSFVDLYSVKTLFSKTLKASDASAYELRGGEVITLYAPKLKNSRSYTSGCKITWTPSTYAASLPGVTSTTDSSGNAYYVLASDNYYKVGTSEGCIGTVSLFYKDAENKEIEDKIPAGDLIICEQAIVSNKTKQIISTGNELKVYTDDVFELDSKTKYMLYIEGKEGSYTLNANTEMLLGVNDYIVYYESSSASWVQLGSGYTLRNNNSTAMTLALVTSKDLLSKAESNFSQLPAKLTVIDNDIISLNQGCSVQLKSYTSSTSATLNITNAVTTAIPASCYVEITDSSGTYEISKNERGVMYRIFSRLDLVFGSEPVALYAGNSITYKPATTSGTAGSAATLTGSDSAPYYLSFSKPVTVVGANEIRTKDVELFHYKETVVNRNNDNLLEPDSGTFYDLTGSNTFLKYLIPIHVEGTTAVTVHHTSTTAVYSMNQLKSSGTLTNQYGAGDYILSVPANASKIKFTFASATCSVQVGAITVVDAINSDELSGKVSSFAVPTTEGFAINSTNLFSKILIRANELASSYKIDYTYKVTNENKCIHPTDAESFFNANHVYNNFIIAQMDTSAYEIKVNQFSIK